MSNKRANTNMNKVFICMANSRKLSGRCIAGKEFENNQVGNWVRPISARAEHEISENDRRYSDGSTAQVWDIIDAPFKNKSQHAAQEENYLIDDGYYWEKVGQYSGSIDALIDSPPTLWQNGSSGYNGTNDRVPVASISQPVQSLYFIAPSSIDIIVRTEGAEFNNAKRKVRADFTYNGASYLLSITDPVVEQTYLAQGEGTYQLSGNIYMTISLGEALNGYYYKLVAGLFEAK
ncbi:dual OB domain-containing protein [Gynuella sunshinyii]|uniref:Dual OB-containing domain-containing protein n=1 Tax=Gynuella sunshinyii YC6258 TaxID=1445510 RepID=A0A0C5VQN8_9GAMM|nr:hypothetical protein [Gynuella sunshinyii]AJQ96912.1 hypothetical Protein YC6258_04880 [Gynuella sunshinyii YC6258]